MSGLRGPLRRAALPPDIKTAFSTSAMLHAIQLVVGDIQPYSVPSKLC